jgi:hypothetical protein
LPNVGVATTLTTAEKARELARGLSEKPDGGAGQVGLIGEARVDRGEGDRLRGQAEDGRPEALPPPQVHRRGAGLNLDESAQARRRQSDRRGDIPYGFG